MIPTSQMSELRPEERRNLLRLVEEPDPNPRLQPGLFNLSVPCLPGASRLMGRQILKFLPWGGGHQVGIVPVPASRGQPFRVGNSGSGQPTPSCGEAEHRPQHHDKQKSSSWGFPGGAVVKNPPANAGDTGSSPGPGGSHVPRSN